MTQSKLVNFRRANSHDIPAMSRIRLAVAENVLSDPSRITGQMYEDYLELLGRGWVAEIDGAVAGFWRHAAPRVGRVRRKWTVAHS